MAVIESQVARGELLVAKESSVFATIEHQVRHKASRPIVHENTLLSIGGSSIGAHIEDDILERSGLGNLPMNSSSYTNRHSSSINDEVADLAEEIVLIRVPRENVRTCFQRRDKLH